LWSCEVSGVEDLNSQSNQDQGSQIVKCATLTTWLSLAIPSPSPLSSQSIMQTNQKTRSQLLSEKAQCERQQCSDWLLQFMRDGQPKTTTKDELRTVAMQTFGVSRNSFDFAWIDAIETTGRHDWYDPLPRRRIVKS
jgi:hypothetical protein